MTARKIPSKQLPPARDITSDEYDFILKLRTLRAATTASDTADKNYSNARETQYLSDEARITAKNVFNDARRALTGE